MLSHEEAARALGMKTREVVEVVEVGPDWVATLHDGTRMRLGGEVVRDAAGLVLKLGEVGELTTEDDDDTGVLTLVGERGPERVDFPTSVEVHSGETVLGQARADALAEVPEGTVDEVLAWVDGDPERAMLASIAEQEREKPRSTLLAKLDELMSQ
jgi:hypothetical protein